MVNGGISLRELCKSVSQYPCYLLPLNGTSRWLRVNPDPQKNRLIPYKEEEAISSLYSPLSFFFSRRDRSTRTHLFLFQPALLAQPSPSVVFNPATATATHQSLYVTERLIWHLIRWKVRRRWKSSNLILEISLRIIDTTSNNSKCFYRRTIK